MLVRPLTAFELQDEGGQSGEVAEVFTVCSAAQLHIIMSTKKALIAEVKVKVFFKKQ